MKIPNEIIDKLISQARQDAPNESCGYLLGVSGPDGDVVTENYWMENIDHSSEHFSFAPKDQFAALKYARQNGLKILANWHSHPASPSRPSQEDLRLANDPTIRYAILPRPRALRRRTSAWLTILPFAMPSFPFTKAFILILSKY